MKTFDYKTDLLRYVLRASVAVLQNTAPYGAQTSLAAQSYNKKFSKHFNCIY